MGNKKGLYANINARKKAAAISKRNKAKKDKA
jgi:hypothetical protein